MYAPTTALLTNLGSSFFSFLLFSGCAILYLGFLAKSILLKSSFHNSSLFMRFISNIWMIIGLLVIILNLFLSFFKFTLMVSHIGGRYFFQYLVLPYDEEQRYFYGVFENMFYFFGFEIEKIILHFTILILLFSSVIFVYVLSQDILVELKIFEALQFQFAPKLVGPFGKFIFGSNAEYKRRSHRIGFENGVSSPKLSIFKMKSKIFLLSIMGVSFILFFCVNLEPIVRLLETVLNIIWPEDWIWNFVLELICTVLVFVPYCTIAGFCSILCFFIVKSKMDDPRKFKIENAISKTTTNEELPEKKKEKTQVEEMDEINEIYEIKEVIMKKSAIQSAFPILTMTIILVFINIIFGIHSFMIDIEFFLGFSHTKLIFLIGLLALFIQNLRLSRNLTKATKKLEEVMKKVDTNDELITNQQQQQPQNSKKGKDADKSKDDELKFVENSDDDEEDQAIIQEPQPQPQQPNQPEKEEEEKVERPETPTENLKDKFVLDENEAAEEEEEELIK